MTHYLTQLAMKMVVFADSERIIEAFFLTPFGCTRRVGGNWVLVFDQDVVNQAIGNLDRYEVDWCVSSAPKPENEIPAEHELVLGLDSGPVPLETFRKYLHSRSQAPTEHIFPDSDIFSSRLLPFLEALETNDHISARQRFLRVCEGTPANDASRKSLGKFISNDFKSRPKAKSLDQADVTKLNQLAKALEDTVSACCTSEWYVLLKNLGQVAIPRI